jgi:hypothetical protein
MKYYANGVDIDGNDVDLHVGLYGTLYCSNKKLVSLESNAIFVNCWNNCLTELNLPNATHVYCWNNCLTSLNLSNAKKVYCENNKLPSLNLPKVKFVRSDTKNLKTILNLILDRAINGSELELIIIIN